MQKFCLNEASWFSMDVMRRASMSSKALSSVSVNAAVSTHFWTLQKFCQNEASWFSVDVMRKAYMSSKALLEVTSLSLADTADILQVIDVGEHP